LAHLEIFLRTAGPITDFRKGKAPDFAWYFMVSGHSFAAGKDRLLLAENQTVMSEARTQAVNLYLQIARARARRGFADERWANYGLMLVDEKDQPAIAVKLVEEFQDSPDLETLALTWGFKNFSQERAPWFKEYCERLLASKSPKVQACARKLLQSTAPESAPPSPVVEEAIVTEYSFAPLKLGTELRGQRGWAAQAPSQWISAGPDMDLCWSSSVLYRMDRNGRLDKIWEFDESGNPSES
jgi:hypothetical protein